MDLSRTTRTVRAGIENDEAHGSVVPPIYLSTNYAFMDVSTKRAFDYSRSGNPTRAILADAIVELEGGSGGVITASGMGAIAASVHAFLPAGSTLVAPHDCYGGTWRLFEALAAKGQYKLVLLDLTSPGASERVADAEPGLVWIESPSNPLLRLTDIAAVSAAAHAVGALVAVDNTFCSPVLQRPLEHGADVVVHSTTKYLNGHSDVVGGAVIGRTPELAADAAWWANCLGVTGPALDSYLTLRGLRTLKVRMDAHVANASRIAAEFTGHPALNALHYPGLPDHPDFALAQRQQDGPGGIVTLDVIGGAEGIAAFLDGLQCFSLAESLGGVESLVAHPGTMTHAAMPPDVQAAAGLTPGMLRLSIGIEDGRDLVADLGAALDRVQRAVGGRS